MSRVLSEAEFLKIRETIGYIGPDGMNLNPEMHEKIAVMTKEGMFLLKIDEITIDETMLRINDKQISAYLRLACIDLQK